MSLSIANRLLSILPTLLLGCAAAPAIEHEIDLSQRTVELEGWLVIKGEWIVFPNKDFESYTPYDKRENAKCVSLVAIPGLLRSKYLAYDGKKVLVKGLPVAYDRLPTGTTVSDRLLSKKYFNDEMVENFCLRDFVFAVTTIQVE